MKESTFRVPLHFYPDTTLDRYQMFFQQCPVPISVEEENFYNTGGYVMLSIDNKDYRQIKQYIYSNNKIVGIDYDTLAEMMDKW